MDGQQQNVGDPPASDSPRFRPQDLPQRIRSLPLDRRGFPVPWFVQWFKHGVPSRHDVAGAQPNFVVMDEKKRVRAVKSRLCWVCGQPLGRNLCFVIGPMCGVSRTSAEPPLHRDCALFSVKACPFLANPRMRRAEVLKPDGATAPGLMIDRNPGVSAIWITERYTPFEVRNGFLIHMGEPVAVMWFREGRVATRDEVMESVTSGLPILRKVAMDESTAAVDELERMIVAFDRYLPGRRHDGI
jgi:hypothetical protein